MQRILLIFLIFFSVSELSAQDTIIKRNGDELQTKILEINVHEIKYKRFDNLDGPVITILKSDVFMIKFENGTTENFSHVTSHTPSSPYTGTVYQEKLRLSGPRLGFTVLSQGTVNRFKDNFDGELNPFITQFGWQFETRIFTLENGVSGLFEFVPLIGGLEQGMFLPSLSALIGIRGRTGFEFGLGPNLSLAGAGIVFAVGANFQTQGINFPVNLAVAPSQYGSRVSLLVGFNSSKY